MSERQAKRKRQLFRAVYGTESDGCGRNIIPAPRLAFRERRYVVGKEGKKLVRTGRLTPRGNPEQVIMYWRTIKLHPSCPRVLYQQLKAAA